MNDYKTKITCFTPYCSIGLKSNVLDHELECCLAKNNDDPPAAALQSLNKVPCQPFIAPSYQRQVQNVAYYLHNDHNTSV